MVIHVREVTDAADTSTQGFALYSALRCAFQEQHDYIVVSFDGIDAATSSFVNSSFAALLSDVSLEDIRTRIRVVASTRQINEMIRRCLKQKTMLVV